MLRRWQLRPLPLRERAAGDAANQMGEGSDSI